MSSSSLYHKSLIDHVVVSNELKACISNYCIVCDDANMSDHLPVTFMLSYSSNGHSEKRASNGIKTICEYRWDKGDLVDYYLYSGMLLNRIHHVFSCQTVAGRCKEVDHHLDIEIYYEEIVHCLQASADLCVLKIPKSALKHYWSVELNELKQKSCEACNIWYSAGKPKSGDLYMLKKRCTF
jgi:hypothetical protein